MLALVDCFNLFASPPAAWVPASHDASPRGPSHGRSSDLQHKTLAECFSVLDLDGDHVISRRDAQQALGSEWLADMLHASFAPLSHPLGISWKEFSSDPEHLVRFMSVLYVFVFVRFCMYLLLCMFVFYVFVSVRFMLVIHVFVCVGGCAVIRTYTRV